MENKLEVEEKPAEKEETSKPKKSEITRCSPYQVEIKDGKCTSPKNSAMICALCRFNKSKKR